MPFAEQMANVGSEIERRIAWKSKGRADYGEGRIFQIADRVVIVPDILNREPQHGRASVFFNGSRAHKKKRYGSFRGIFSH